MKSYIIIDWFTQEVYGEGGVWESLVTDDKNNYFGSANIYYDKSEAERIKEKLANEFLTNGDNDLDFDVIEVEPFIIKGMKLSKTKSNCTCNFPDEWGHECPVHD